MKRIRKKCFFSSHIQKWDVSAKVIKSLAFVVLLFCISSLSAQQTGLSVSGKVMDESGESLPGTTIVVKNTTIGTVSDIDGAFAISNVPAQSTLVFSFVGMQTQEIPVNGKTSFNVSLKQDAIGIDEVVAVGYGTMRKSDVTGSVASVRSDDIIASGQATVEQALSGRTAGVVIDNSDNSPGAGMNIKIRGTSSINASSAPLYVIDGFPIEGSFNSGGLLSSTGESVLASLNPNDIESIDILKDASATAIYGARGANGVVIITTKSGGEGKMTVSYNSSYGIQSMIDAYEPLDAAGYAKNQHDRYFKFDKRITPPQPGDDFYNYWDYQAYASPDTTNTNWLDEITQLGEIQNHSLSLSGGNDKANYLASISYHKNKGIVKETDFTRYTGNFKAQGNPNDWLELSFNSRMSYSENNGTVTINSSGSAAYAGIIQQAVRTKPLKSPDDEFIIEDGISTDGVTGNPLSTLEGVDMLRTSLNSVTNLSVTIKPWKGVRIKTLGGMTHGYNNFYRYWPSTTSWGANFNGSAAITGSKSTSWLNENTISYTSKIDKHNISALAGFTVQSNSFISIGMENGNFPIENLGYKNIGVGEVPSAPSSFAQEYLLLSYLGRINYSFDNRYLITASFRADGSSKFSENNKWGYFPSVALAWRASEEDFIKDLGFISTLKLRAGWGETGNPNIAPYQSLSVYNLTKYPSGTSLSTGVVPGGTGNKFLKWETAVATNVGLDLSVLNSRLSFTVDAYLKETKDLLLSGDIPPSTGFSSYLYNSGSVENKGIEVAINALIVDKELKWFSDFNISFNENKITDLGELTTTDWINVPGTDNYSTAILEEGSPIGLWYGYETDGLWQQDEFTWNGTAYELNPDSEGNYPAILGGQGPGNWKFKDLSGPDGVPDGKIDSWDKTVIGKSQPKFVGGFNNRLEYKNFDLALFLEFSYGRDVYNVNNRFFIEQANAAANSIVADTWLPIQYALDDNGLETTTILDPGNPDGKYPGPGYGTPYQDMHDAYIEDGSYLRIKNVSLGYRFNPSALKPLGVKSLRVYANVLNLYTFTNYSGFDPNVNANDLGGLRPGYDFSSYPLSRTFMFGVSAEF